MRFLKTLILICLFLPLRTLTVAQEIETYDWPTAEGEAILSDTYKVTLVQNDQEIASEVIQSESKDDEIPDFAQEFRGGRTFNWTMFSYGFESPVTITVEKLFGEAATEVELVPSPYGLESVLSEDGRSVSFVLEKPDYVCVNFKTADNLHTSDGVVKHMMMVFAEPPETDIPDKKVSNVHVVSNASAYADFLNADIIYFPRGYYDSKVLFGDIGNMGPMINKDNKKVYFEGGAYVHGRIKMKTGSFQNVKIYGRGVLTGRDFKWDQKLPQNGGVLGVDSYPANEAHIGIDGSGNSIEGIIVCDGAGHGVNLGSNSTYYRLKIWGWHPNNDGMRPWGANNTIDHCFVRACDDAMYNKGLTVTNTIFWQGFNGAIITLGWDGFYDTENSTLRDNYIIYPEWRGVGNNNGIVMSQLDYDMKGTNVIIQNLFVDGNVPAILNIHTNSRKSDVGDYELPTDRPSGGLGYISGISLTDVRITGDQVKFDGNSFDQTAVPTKSVLTGAQLDGGLLYKVSDISLNNVSIGDECITPSNYSDYIEIDDVTVSNVTISGGISFKFAKTMDELSFAEAQAATDTFDIITEADHSLLIFPILQNGSESSLEWYDETDQFISSSSHLTIDNVALGETIYYLNYTYNNCEGSAVFRIQGEEIVLATDPEIDICLYPNPADEFLRIGSALDNVNFNLLDTSGRIVLQGTGPLVNLDDLPSGIYIIAIDGLKRTYRIIKK